MSKFLYFLLVGDLVSAVKLPSEIPLCHKSDPNFDNCVARSMEKALRLFQNGSKELGIPRLEPYLISKLEINSIASDSVTLNQLYENLLTYGITISEIYKAKYEMTNGKCYWSMHVLTPNIRMEADFKVTGKVLMFPLNGQGRCNITITNLRNHHQAFCDRVQKKGKTYLTFSNYTQDMSVDTIYFGFPNLIPGNEQLSESVLKTINDNSQEVFQEVKFGFEKIWGISHLNAVRNVFSRIPENEAFLD